jgi:hypothetical protein
MQALIRSAGSLALAAVTCLALGTAQANAGPYRITEIAEISGNSGFNLPAINDAGTVVFHMQNNTTGEQAIFTGTGGPLTRVVDNLGGPYVSFGDPVINTGGSVAFLAGLSTGGAGIFRVSGGQTATIATNVEDGGSFTLLRSSSLSINAKGTVAFAAQRDAGLSGIYTGNGGPLTTVVDNKGPYQDFFGHSFLGAVGIDGQGTVVFGAGSMSGTQGLFSGPDPLADKVIGLNDMLDGARVNYLTFYPNGMNDRGQIAFFASLSDGRQGIFRADPASVPEPS